MIRPRSSRPALVVATGLLGMLMSGPLPASLDGLAPGTAYRYLRPPAGSGAEGMPLDASMIIRPGLSASNRVETGDGQAAIDFGHLVAGRITQLTVTITAVDPAAPPPPRVNFSGNVYRVLVDSTPADAAVPGPIQFSLRWADAVPDSAWIREESGWVPVPITLDYARDLATGRLPHPGDIVQGYRGTRRVPPSGSGLGSAGIAIAILGGLSLFWLYRRQRRLAR